MTRKGRRFLVPEVVQSSAMDCGPAALKSLLEGFGVAASYGRLREACQTDVDGTSIDTLEVLAQRLGLEAEQVMLPLDHLLLDEAEALPALVVARLPQGGTHFVVGWRRVGGLVQLMDPATGRRWVGGRRFLDEVYVHAMPVEADRWMEWARGDGLLAPLHRRLARLGAKAPEREALIGAALAVPGWEALARADAATRLVQSLLDAEALEPGPDALRVLRRYLEVDGSSGMPEIPDACWSVRRLDGAEGDGERLLLRGAVIIRVRGVRGAAGGEPADDEANEENVPLSRELAAALEERTPGPAGELLRLMRQDGLLAPSVLLAALACGACGAVVEGLLLRGLLDLGVQVRWAEGRLGAIGAVLVFMAALLLLQVRIASATLAVGRRLDVRLRMAFLGKIPKLKDRYFQSRLTSDMAERSHNVHALRMVPELGAQFIRATFEILATAAGLAWLDPPSAPVAALAVVACLGLPLVFQPALSELDLRVRTLSGALARFYLDALLGLVPLRTHVAERTVRGEHERMLIQWGGAGLRLQRAAVAVEGAQALVGYGLAVWLFVSYVSRVGESGASLLLVYWALRIPMIAHEAVQIARQYPYRRNVTLRLVEPLGALEDPPPVVPDALDADRRSPSSAAGVAVEMRAVSVRAGGCTILEDVDISLEPGSHVAVVGASGAGKSSLLGLLLGWHQPATGALTVDGAPLDGPRLARLRQECAWVDPSVQLWNRSLIDNLAYGLAGEARTSLARIIDLARLRGVVERLSLGLQTPLGEGGALVSGGEGQRVRLARGLLRPGVRLALLDEPFRGLDRELRQDLLATARDLWRDATLLCVTHDIGQTLRFDRVLVVADGRVVEDGPPAELAASPGSRYQAMLESEARLGEAFRTATAWRRLRLEEGRLHDA